MKKISVICILFFIQICIFKLPIHSFNVTVEVTANEQVKILYSILYITVQEAETKHPQIHVFKEIDKVCEVI